MPLLQISEPGESPIPHLRKLAIGIDLGTTNSLVATVRNSIPTVLNDAQGHPLLPSIVHYVAPGEVQVGYEAQAKQSIDPLNTIVSVKRFMGRGLKDVVHAENAPYDFVDAPGMVQLKTVAGIKSPVEISAEILGALKRRAEDALGGDLVGAVITVPAYFDDAQRQATKDAARLAGLNVLRLLNEPTAAAVAYGLDNAVEGIYAIYDLGGGTFDISILRLTKGVFEVLATNGDAALGGDDFDQRLFCWIMDEAELKFLSPQDTRLLMVNARDAKERLSSAADTRIFVRLGSGKTIDLTLTASKFCEITQTLVNKTLTPTKKALRDAGLNISDIAGVVMVGGATRMPHIQRAMADFFRQAPLNNLDPDKVVAIGAAIQANALAGNRSADEDWLLLDVIPLSLGIETMGGLAEKLIPRNATIPVARAQEFTTFKDGQTAMSLHVVQGERELVSDCRSLARFELRGIPPMAAGAAHIRVTFQVDADGLLSVAAREMSSGVESAIAVKPSYGLSDAQITQMLKDSFDHAKGDVRLRASREAQVEGERLMEALNAALVQDAGLLDATQETEIRRLMAVLRTAIDGSDHRAIKVAVERLNKGSEAFAALRMDTSVKRALTGQSVDKLGV